jgi:hypothetical protein
MRYRTLRLHVYVTCLSWVYPNSRLLTLSTIVAYRIKSVSVTYVNQSSSSTTTQLLLYSVKSCGFTKGWPSHQVFCNWHWKTCGLFNDSVSLATRSFRHLSLSTPEDFRLHLIVIKFSICGRMKDVLREKVRSFGEQNASHLSVSLQTYGQSGLRRL